MDDTESFVTQENVARFFGGLEGEQDLKRQVQLSTVLLEEEDRFYHLAARVDQMEFYISRCDVHIGKNEALFNGDNSDGQKSLQRLVENLRQIRSTLRSTLRVYRDRLDRLEAP